MTNNRALVDEVSRMDNIVDNLNEAIKLYLTNFTRGNLDESEAKRAMEIVSFAINLEHVGDIIDKNLSELAAKKIKRNVQFSDDGAAEIDEFHKRILEESSVSLLAYSCRATLRGRASSFQKKRIYAVKNCQRPSVILIDYGRGGPKPWKLPRCTSTSCAI